MHIIHIHVDIHRYDLGRTSLYMGRMAVKSLRKHSICLMIASERLKNIPLKDNNLATTTLLMNISIYLFKL